VKYDSTSCGVSFGPSAVRSSTPLSGTTVSGIFIEVNTAAETVSTEQPENESDNRKAFFKWKGRIQAAEEGGEG